LYGYFSLTKQPSGTQATSGPGASTSPKVSSRHYSPHLPDECSALDAS
jgi:hypothetical protein